MEETIVELEFSHSDALDVSWKDRTRRKALMKKRALDASSSGGDVGSFVGRDG